MSLKIEVDVFEVRAILDARLGAVGEAADELIEAVNLENYELDDIQAELDDHFNKAGAALDQLAELLNQVIGAAANAPEES